MQLTQLNSVQPISAKQVSRVELSCVAINGPLHITSAQSLAVFKQRLKTFLFSRSYLDILIMTVTYLSLLIIIIVFFFFLAFPVDLAIIDII